MSTDAERNEYPDPKTVDWHALQFAQMQAVSGVAQSVHLIAQAVDEIGSVLSMATGKPWTPVSDRVPTWPDERDPRFRTHSERG